MTPTETLRPTKHEVIDPEHLRGALGQYPTGVVVVTGVTPSGQSVAMVVGTFTSVSLDPPLVGFLPTKSSQSYARLKECTHLCFNVLSHAQDALCRKLSSKDADKFNGVSWVPGVTGSPIIEGCVAWFEGSVESITEAGDHDFVLVRVVAFDVPNPELPLLFFQGSFGKFNSSSFVMPNETALLPVITEIERHRHLLEDLSKQLGREIVVFAPIADELVIAASAGTEPNRTTSIVGRRFPFSPPFGSLLVGDSEFDSWFARLHTKSDTKEMWQRKLTLARERGWSVALLSDDHPELDRLIEEFSRGPHTPNLQRRLLNVMQQLGDAYEPVDSEIRGDSQFRMISVPVTNAGGVGRFLISIHSIANPIPAAGLESVVSALQATATQIEADPQQVAYSLPKGKPRERYARD